MEAGVSTQAGKWDKWAAIRAKGAMRFVLLYGVAGWGLCTAVLFSAAMVVFNDAPMAVVPVAFVIFPLGGIAWGAAMWWFGERAYAKHLATGAG
jgi:hypothetical protein